MSVTQMHGPRDLTGKMDTPDRMAQARKLRQLSKDVAKPDGMTMISADFNGVPDSRTLLILAEAGLCELVTGRGFNGTRNAHCQKSRRFADDMLINREDVIQSFEVIHGPEASDPCPLVIHL